jgi:hypothetical protein
MSLSRYNLFSPNPVFSLIPGIGDGPMQTISSRWIAAIPFPSSVQEPCKGFMGFRHFDSAKVTFRSVIEGHLPAWNDESDQRDDARIEWANDYHILPARSLLDV